MNASIDRESLFTIAFSVLSLLCDAFGKSNFLHSLCVKTYTRKLKGKRAVKLQSLPPTSVSAQEHALRIKLILDQWQGREGIDPKGNGWQLTDNGSVLFKDILLSVLKIFSTS